MAGYWSVENVYDYEELWIDDESGAGVYSFSRETPDGNKQWLDGITTLLIWSLPSTNIEEITIENAEEVFVRLRMWELTHQPVLSVDGKPAYISPQDVQRRIGLIAIPDVKPCPFEETILAALSEKARKVWKMEVSLRDENKK